VIRFAGLTVALAVALSAGFSARSMRVGWGIGYGIVLVLFIAYWVTRLRRPRRLEVTEEAVRYVRGNGRQEALLSRESGNDLGIVEKRYSRGGRRWWLVQSGSTTDTVIH
jgi:hypothetical protein